MTMKFFSLLLISFVLFFPIPGFSVDDGYGLWLKARPLSEEHQKKFDRQVESLLIKGESPTMKIVENELISGLETMLGKKLSPAENSSAQNAIIAGKFENIKFLNHSELEKRVQQLGDEGYLIFSEKGKNTKNVGGEIGICGGLLCSGMSCWYLKR